MVCACACACVCGLEFNNKYGSNTNQRGANYKKIFNGVCVCVCGGAAGCVLNADLDLVLLKDTQACDPVALWPCDPVTGPQGHRPSLTKLHPGS